MKELNDEVISGFEAEFSPIGSDLKSRGILKEGGKFSAHTASVRWSVQLRGSGVHEGKRCRKMCQTRLEAHYVASKVDRIIRPENFQRFGGRELNDISRFTEYLDLVDNRTTAIRVINFGTIAVDRKFHRTCSSKAWFLRRHQGQKPPGPVSPEVYLNRETGKIEVNWIRLVDLVMGRSGVRLLRPDTRDYRKLSLEINEIEYISERDGTGIVRSGHD